MERYCNVLRSKLGGVEAEIATLRDELVESERISAFRLGEANLFDSKLEEAEEENATLRAKLVEYGDERFALQEEIATLRAELEEAQQLEANIQRQVKLIERLRADGERLDWIEANNPIMQPDDNPDDPKWFVFYGDWDIETGVEEISSNTIRSAIDAARADEGGERE
eukprot:GHVR01162775.1.p1 GENE.GHVR01162775.1~~GHVR01162775.1.p1  ORF type:complete len:168 (+),score=40.63 GHVR01162775.1:158-661(+)